MSRFFKIFAVCSSAFLILMDCYVFVRLTDYTGAQLFSAVMWNMLPCGVLFGVTSLLHIFDKPLKKYVAIFSAIIFGATFLIRFFAVGLFLIDRITTPDLAPMTVTDYAMFANLAGYGVLMFAAIFYVVYILKGKLVKTTVIISNISFVVLILTWGVNIYQLISGILGTSGTVLQILSEFFLGDLFWNLVTIVAYMLIFYIHTDSFKGKVKKN